MNNTTSRLLAATSSTFERLGFLFAEQELTDEQQAAQVGAAARVAFEGPFSGVVEVHTTGNVLPELTANMLGEATEADQRLHLDALGEVANVITGNVLPALGGSTAVFSLQPPTVVDTPSQFGAAAYPLVANGSLGVGDGRVDVFLYLSEPVEVATS